MKHLHSALGEKWSDHILEIMVITIGIARVLYLDKWNDELKQDKLELNYPERFSEDLKKDAPYPQKRSHNIIKIISNLENFLSDICKTAIDMIDNLQTELRVQK